MPENLIKHIIQKDNSNFPAVIWHGKDYVRFDIVVMAMNLFREVPRDLRTEMKIKTIMRSFENDLCTILEVEEIKDDQFLDSFECWDSMTRLSIIALADRYKVIISDAELHDNTIGGLKTMIQNRMK